eukprot:TRINITY_DN26767_c0_g1_i1.p1 TRINITY_DN26767_c0_g1~~TRINITY_DN26767_c0_g1_i1.p1  ORF type:complete len:663 (+),score=196.37 TRINITY_DN26767_c0_g1_i1:63-2051(+)
MQAFWRVVLFFITAAAMAVPMAVVMAPSLVRPRQCECTALPVKCPPCVCVAPDRGPAPWPRHPQQLMPPSTPRPTPPGKPSSKALKKAAGMVSTPPPVPVTPPMPPLPRFAVPQLSAADEAVVAQLRAAPPPPLLQQARERLCPGGNPTDAAFSAVCSAKCDRVSSGVNEALARVVLHEQQARGGLLGPPVRPLDVPAYKKSCSGLKCLQLLDSLHVHMSPRSTILSLMADVYMEKLSRSSWGNVTEYATKRHSADDGLVIAFDHGRPCDMIENWAPPELTRPFVLVGGLGDMLQYGGMSGTPLVPGGWNGTGPELFKTTVECDENKCWPAQKRPGWKTDRPKMPGKGFRNGGQWRPIEEQLLKCGGIAAWHKVLDDPRLLLFATYLPGYPHAKVVSLPHGGYPTAAQAFQRVPEWFSALPKLQLVSDRFGMKGLAVPYYRQHALRWGRDVKRRNPELFRLGRSESEYLRLSKLAKELVDRAFPGVETRFKDYVFEVGTSLFSLAPPGMNSLTSKVYEILAFGTVPIIETSGAFCDVPDMPSEQVERIDASCIDTDQLAGRYLQLSCPHRPHDYKLLRLRGQRDWLKAMARLGPEAVRSHRAACQPHVFDPPLRTRPMHEVGEDVVAKGKCTAVRFRWPDPSGSILAEFVEGDTQSGGASGP